MQKLKKFFPIIVASCIFVMLLVAQMSLHGTSSSASKLNLSNEKIQAYQVTYADLSLETTKGTIHNLSEVKQPIVILNFWASWCRPCLSEFESLKKIVDKYGSEKVLVVGINNNSENQNKEIISTEKKLNLNFQSVADKDSVITSKFFINEIPASIVFHKGKVIHFENREFDFMSKKFIALIDSKLAED